MVPYGRRLTLALVVALVVIAVSGAGLAYLAGGDNRLISGNGTISEASAGDPPASSAAAEIAGAAVTDAPSEAGTTVDGTSTPTLLTVTLSPSAENSPQARDVSDLIARYFGAINRHDYDAWLSTVTTAQARRDRDSWTVDYSTTRDSDVYISDINPGDPLTVRMQFTSHQALNFAPPELPAECVRWDVTYQVLDEGVGLRVGTSAKKPEMAPC